MKLGYENLWKLFMVLLLISAVSACHKKTVPAAPDMGSGSSFGSGGMGSGGGLDDAKWRELGITSEAEKREFLDKAANFENQDVYFDYDAYTLSEPAKRVLDEKIAFIKRWPKVKVTIEGHCDERGTTEYNLALGERRANSGLQYITNSGLGHVNLSTVSYGKERPIATGHDEASYAKNRRDHFALNY